MKSVVQKSLIAAAMGVAMLAMPASAQRNPAYQAARSAGQVGERPDGYLGIVAAETPELRALVNQLNIQRRALYTQEASENGATVEQFAFTTGCNLIARTVPGERYMAPDGRWMTRTSEPPVRDSRCV